MVTWHQRDLHLKGFVGALPRTVKPKGSKRSKRTQVTESESSLQARTEEYLDARGLCYARIPDAMLRAVFANPHVNIGQKRLISAYLKGQPDLIIFHPTKKIDKYPLVLPLELKTERGVMSSSQEEWQRQIGTIVTKGWAETLKEIELFLAQ